MSQQGHATPMTLCVSVKWAIRKTLARESCRRTCANWSGERYAIPPRGIKSYRVDPIGSNISVRFYVPWTRDVCLYTYAYTRILARVADPNSANLVTNLNNRVNTLEIGLNALLTHFGLTQNVDEPNVKTSARVRETPDMSHMATKKSKRLEDVEIVVTDAMAAGRMKIPARMFNGGSKCVVNGTTFHSLKSDQNRSEPFTPHILLGQEVDAGDTVTFSHLGGREWEGSVSAGSGRRSRKTVAKATPKVTKKAKRVIEDDDDETVRFSVPAKARTSKKALIEFFGEVAAKNASDPDFEENVNIRASMQASGRKRDARVFLTTAEQQKFRKYRKALGMSLEESIELLNSEYAEYV